VTCPCGTGRGYDECCGPRHDGTLPAVTAEELMRSRYAAFALADADYLRRTWHPATRPATLELDPRQVWTRLRVLDTRHGGLDDADGEVTFRAHYRLDGEPGAVQEHSTFRRVDGRWYYVDAR
jgi:SEC-C motif-containing protein